MTSRCKCGRRRPQPDRSYTTLDHSSPDGHRWVNTYFSRLPELFGASHYDDTTLYPYFSDAQTPLSGDERVAVFWQNFGVALSANAPQFGVGEYGFPFEFRPTWHWHGWLQVNGDHYACRRRPA